MIHPQDETTELINDIVRAMFPDLDHSFLDKHRMSLSRIEGSDFQSPIAFKIASMTEYSPHQISSGIKFYLDKSEEFKKIVLS